MQSGGEKCRRCGGSRPGKTTSEWHSGNAAARVLIYSFNASPIAFEPEQINRPIMERSSHHTHLIDAPRRTSESRSVRYHTEVFSLVAVRYRTEVLLRSSYKSDTSI